jgi:hypothetical protein
MKYFPNRILVTAVVAALLCIGCGPVVRSVGLDVRVETPQLSAIPVKFITVEFATLSGKHLCGGSVSVTAFPGLVSPPTVEYDIRDGEARISVPKGTEFVILRVTYPHKDFPADSITIHDTTLVMDISGGC